MPPATRVTRGALAAAEDFASLSSRDRLIFAQAVYEYGARQGSWNEIAKVLSKHPLISKPKNFSSAQSCVAIYNHLMKEAELERTDLCEAKKSPIHAQLAQRFYRGRVTELRDQIAVEEDRFKTLVNQIEEIRAGKWDDKIRAQLNGTEISLELPQTTQAKSPEAVESPPIIEDSEDAVPAQEDHPMEAEEQQTETPTRAELPVEVPASDGEVSMDVSSPVRASSPEAFPPESSPRPQQESPKPTDERAVDFSSTESELSPVPPISEEPPSTSPKQMPKTRSRTRKEPIEPVETSPLEQEDVEMAEAEDETETEEQETQEKEEEEDVMVSPGIPSDKPTPEQPVLREEESEELVSRESTPTTPAPQERRESKRRVSDVDAVEPSRDRKRTREKSESVEYADSPAPATPVAISSAAGMRDAKERKRFQSVILMLHAQITAHRNGTIFHNPIKPSEAPDYQDIVKRPMDLKTIKNRVKDGRISSSSEYQRDIYLMFANSLMYNRPNSDIYMMAEEMMQDSDAEIQNFQQTEAYNLRTRG